MNIEWTLCSERMPPDEQIIVRYQSDKPKLFDGSKISDSLARLFPDLMRKTAWTEFTKEKWEFLNR